MMKIAFFGGTFDPPHLGHVRLAKKFLGHVDEVWFCPANISPWKQDHPPMASGQERLEMVRLATKGQARFKVYDAEVKRGGVSYTVDTLRVMKEMGHELFLIVSAEEAEGVPKWEGGGEILEMCTVLKAPRTEESATDIRRRIKEKLDCRALVPDKVLDYISANQLYS